MQPSELELYTSEELIQELLRRTTFLGVVVNAAQGLRSAEWEGEKVFQVRFNGNLSGPEAGRLLDVVAGHLDRAAD